MSVRRLGAGPPVVWIHGLGEWSLSFDAVVVHPALAGFTHVLPDLWGCGRSPWPASSEPSTLDHVADRLACWLAGQPLAAVIGHSMGGVLATLLAERLAIRALVDIEGNLTAGDCTFSRRAADASLASFVTDGLAALRADVYRAGVTASPLRGYHAALCVTDPVTFHRCATDLVALTVTERLGSRLANLRIPTLYVAGIPDGICEASRAALDRLGVRWIGIEPAGHWVYVDQLDRFAAAVGSFLRER